MRTSLVVLPGIGCLNRIGFTLLFLACPIIALKGQENREIEPYCKFLTLKQRWLTEDPGIQAFDSRNFREYGYNKCDLGFIINGVQLNKSLNHFSAGISKRERLNGHLIDEIQRIDLTRNTPCHTNLIQNHNIRQNVRNVKQIDRHANANRLARKMQEFQRENKETRGHRSLEMSVVEDRQNSAINKKQMRDVRTVGYLERYNRMIRHTSELQQQNREILITNSVDRVLNENRRVLRDNRENVQASFRQSLLQTPKDLNEVKDERRDHLNKREIRQVTNSNRITQNKYRENRENIRLDHTMGKQHRLISAFTDHERNTLPKESTLQRFQIRNTRTIMDSKDGFRDIRSTLDRRTREIRKSDNGNSISRSSQQSPRENKDRISVSLKRIENARFDSPDTRDRMLFSRQLSYERIDRMRNNDRLKYRSDKNFQRLLPMQVEIEERRDFRRHQENRKSSPRFPQKQTREEVRNQIRDFHLIRNSEQSPLGRSLNRADETEFRITRDSLTKHSRERTYRQVKSNEHMENNIPVRRSRQVQRNEETRYPKLVFRSVRNTLFAPLLKESSDILERRTSFMRRSLQKITTQVRNADLHGNRNYHSSGRSSLGIVVNRESTMRRNSAERINPDMRNFASQEFGRLDTGKMRRILLQMPRRITLSRSLNFVIRMDDEMRKSRQTQQSKTKETVKSALSQNNDRTSRSIRSLYVKHRESSTIIPLTKVDYKEKRLPHNDQNNRQLSERHLEDQRITKSTNVNQRELSRNTDWRHLPTRRSQEGIAEIKFEQRIESMIRRSALERIQFRSLPSINKIRLIDRTIARDIHGIMEFNRQRSSEHLKREIRNKQDRENTREEKEIVFSRTLRKVDEQERRLSLNIKEKSLERYRIHSITLARHTQDSVHFLMRRSHNRIAAGIRMVDNKISENSVNRKNILSASKGHVLSAARSEIRMENRLASREMRLNRESLSRYVETRNVQVEDKTLISQALTRIYDRRQSRNVVDHRQSPLKHSTIVRNNVIRESRVSRVVSIRETSVSKGRQSQRNVWHSTKQIQTNFENVEEKDTRLSRDILDYRHSTLQRSFERVRIANHQQTRTAQGITNAKLIREIRNQVKQTRFAPSISILGGLDSKRSLNYIGAMSNIAFDTKENNALVCGHKDNISKETAFASFICDKISSGLQGLNKRLRKFSMNLPEGTSIDGLVTGGIMAVTLFLNTNTKRLFF